MEALLSMSITRRRKVLASIVSTFHDMALNPLSSTSMYSNVLFRVQSHVLEVGTFDAFTLLLIVLGKHI